MEKKASINLDLKMIIGLVVICAGILFLLENLGVTIGVDMWDFWPVALILIGLSHISKPPETRHGFSGAIFIIVGVLFLLNNLDIIVFDIGTFWPIIVILVGMAIIKDAVWGGHKAPSSSDSFNLSFILGGAEYKFASDQFKGGKVSAFVVMGGIEIRVPRNWHVNIEGTPILGGIDNKTVVMSKQEVAANPEKEIRKLTIKGMSIMGGIEVKN